jgi:hypothetical protein
MITGIKITHVEAHRDKDEDMTGLNVNIGIDAVVVKGTETTITFNYAATYSEGVGELKMKGSITSKEDAKLSKDIETRWNADKKLPDGYAEMILNAINYACGTNGVFVVRPVNLSPPIVPPRISLGGEAKP